MTLQERIDAAVEVAEKFGWIDGAHHKQWVIDQMLRALLGDAYQEWRDRYEEDSEDFEWDVGISP